MDDIDFLSQYENIHKKKSSIANWNLEDGIKTNALFYSFDSRFLPKSLTSLLVNDLITVWEPLWPAFDYKLRILDPKIEEFPCLVHKLSVTLTALQYKPQWKMG